MDKWDKFFSVCGGAVLLIIAGGKAMYWFATKFFVTQKQHQKLVDRVNDFSAMPDPVNEHARKKKFKGQFEKWIKEQRERRDAE